MPFLWILLKGFGAGLLISVPTGPVGFLCVRRTSLYGRKAGLVSGLGSVTADVLYALIVLGILRGLGEFFLEYQLPLRFLGASLLLFIGFSFIRKKMHSEKDNIEHKNLWNSYISTFFITATNPIQMITFAALFGSLGIIFHNISGAIFFVAGLAIGAFFWWAGLTVIIDRYRNHIGHETAEQISFVVGIIIFAMGAGIFTTALLQCLHIY